MIAIYFCILSSERQIYAAKKEKSTGKVIICVKQVNDLTFDYFHTTYCFERLHGVVIMEWLQRVRTESSKSRLVTRGNFLNL